MNNEDTVVRLLEAAVPPIPPALRTPPYARIRRRALRRRLAVAGSAAAVTVLVATAGAVATRLLPLRGPSTVVNVPAVSSLEPTTQGFTPPAQPTPLPGAPADAVSWQLVRVDRSGTRLTMYVNPPFEPCQYYPTGTPTVVEGPDYVTVTLTAKSAPVECSRVRASPIQVRLAHPLRVQSLRQNTRQRALANPDRPFYGYVAGEFKKFCHLCEVVAWENSLDFGLRQLREQLTVVIQLSAPTQRSCLARPLLTP